MEHLRSKFHDEINGYGTVQIFDFEFSREDIIRNLEPQGYQEEFDNWLQRRQYDLLKIADEILSQFDNKNRFLQLREIYKQGNVIPFVGAGLSYPSGYPSWTQFLNEARSETNISEEELKKLLNEGKYEDAAQLLFDEMTPAGFNEFLENTYGLDFDLNGPVQLLPHLFEPTSVVTTNFDNVLERVYSNENNPFKEIIIGAQAQELPRMLGKGTKALLKLHGHISSSRGRVLTKEEYEKEYNDEKIVKSAIQSICTRTLLFMGCSLTVDRTIQAMQAYVDENGHHKVTRHYAFLALKKEEDRIKRKNILAKANIFPIWYPEGKHDECIEALLYKLSE